MIEVRQLTYRYPGTAPDAPAALQQISLEVPAGSISAMLGESGSGKTTLLMCLARFFTPTAGEIRIEGRPIADLDEATFRRTLGVVFQRLHLFPHLRVWENLALAPIERYGVNRREARNGAEEILERLGIADLAKSYPNQISGGQAQRVAIARALILKPTYLLLDEPTSALDANTTEEFARWLLTLQSQTTLVIVTHDLPFARRVAKHGVTFAMGNITASGSIEEIVEELLQPAGTES